MEALRMLDAIDDRDGVEYPWDEAERRANHARREDPSPAYIESRLAVLRLTKARDVARRRGGSIRAFRATRYNPGGYI